MQANSGLPMQASSGLPKQSSTGPHVQANGGLSKESSSGLPMQSSIGLPMQTNSGLPMQSSSGLPMQPSTGLPMQTNSRLMRREASDFLVLDSLTPEAKEALSSRVVVERERSKSGASYYCNTCLVSLTGAKPLTQHVEGEKHKKTQRGLRMQREHLPDISSLQVGRGIRKDVGLATLEVGRETWVLGPGFGCRMALKVGSVADFGGRTWELGHVREYTGLHVRHRI